MWTRALEDGRSPIGGEEELAADELFFEAVMLGIRTADGIDVEDLQQRFGAEIAVVDERAVERLAEEGHLRCEGRRIQPTPRGMAIAEGLVRSILP